MNEEQLREVMKLTKMARHEVKKDFELYCTMAGFEANEQAWEQYYEDTMAFY